jgi:rare lipoprotein A
MRRIAHGLAILLSVASLGAGAAQAPNSSESGSTQLNRTRSNAKPVVRKHASKPYQVGTASWYGQDFQGKPTASGEPFDMNDFTAAHMKLPLGTYVRVTNLGNGKSAIVRINDRGPVIEGRIIDVSYNVARALDFKSRGLQTVRLDIIPSRVMAMTRPVSTETAMANLP